LANTTLMLLLLLLYPAINCVSQDTAGLENQHLSRINGYLLPSLRIPAAPGRLRLDLEIAESGYFNGFPTNQGGL